MITDRVILDKIHSVVTEWVDQGKMFTAFEVSLAVKGQGVRERHRNMRDSVHEIIFQLGGPAGYTRTLMDVGAPEQAWVYHRMSDNPYRYQPLDRGDKDGTPDVPYVVPAGVRNPVRLAPHATRPSYAIPDGAYGTDGRGRVCIPVTLLSRLGIGPGQRVDVVCDRANEQLMIVKPVGPAQDNPDASYTVEPDGNVRLTQGTLQKAGLDELQGYRIEGNASAITVRKFDW